MAQAARVAQLEATVERPERLLETDAAEPPSVYAMVAGLAQRVEELERRADAIAAQSVEGLRADLNVVQRGLDERATRLEFEENSGAIEALQTDVALLKRAMSGALDMAWEVKRQVTNAAEAATALDNACWSSQEMLCDGCSECCRVGATAWVEDVYAVGKRAARVVASCWVCNKCWVASGALVRTSLVERWAGVPTGLQGKCSRGACKHRVRWSIDLAFDEGIKRSSGGDWLRGGAGRGWGRAGGHGSNRGNSVLGAAPLVPPAAANTLTDDFSSFDLWHRCLGHLSSKVLEMLPPVGSQKSSIEHQFGKLVKTVRSDNATGYLINRTPFAILNGKTPFQVVPDSFSSGKRAIGCKWVFKIKLRLDYNDTFAHVAKITTYRCLVGRLIYLAVIRPELSYSVHILSQFMQKSIQAHWDAALRVVRYLKGSPGQGIFLRADFFYEGTKHIEVDCHFLADSFTKSLGKQQFDYFLGKLGIRNPHCYGKLDQSFHESRPPGVGPL
ncbi:OLC1v1031230C1 [Oldenlandia corymbosa var. corymbosa]|uniref:OLC1v1031230C1 n=1 Tax=Oldenlandia corymbosa var. corymbosa TaxID=529605 RepID=A0AAV1CI22_OLDCO|nr:OLC1v1031230C1 [Oldenlandia corymbosa var. corymbosa]